MKKLRILMYHANDSRSNIAEKMPLYFSSVCLYLKTHIDINFPELAEHIEWLVPIQEYLEDEELLSAIINNKVDIFCTSHYIWNSSSIFEQLDRIHKNLPKSIKIVVGGPSINANKNDLFFQQYPYVDYAVYSSGEEAFKYVLESIVFKNRIDPLLTSNLVYKNSNNKRVVSPYKYVKQHTISPWLYNKDYFIEMLKSVQDRFTVILIYENTRGCPYSCTFCDWNSGFDNKVSRKKNTYRDEIDLFQSLGIKNIFFSDANLGQYQEDIDIIEYMAEKNLNENAQFKIDLNLSKLRKENNLKMMKTMIRSNLSLDVGYPIAVQDIHESVLKNIERPDVGWETHKKMIIDIKTEFPHIQPRTQLIQGLPGQTLETWRQSLATCSVVGGLSVFVYEFLPNSPASLDPEYEVKFKPKYSNSLRTAFSISTSDNQFHRHYFRGSMIQSCYSFTQEDFIKMTMLSFFYSALVMVSHILKSQYNEDLKLDFEVAVDEFLKSNYYTMLYNNLYENWINNDKFIFSKNFDGYDVEYGADRPNHDSMLWVLRPEFFALAINSLDPSRKEYLINTYVDKENFCVRYENNIMCGWS